MALRDYQIEAVDAVFQKHRDGCKSLLGVAATGAGKTVIFSEIARRWKGRVLIVAHREELISQAREKLWTWTGEHAGIEMGGLRATPMDRVVIASIQTICRENRKIEGPPPSLLIVDEAHHAAAETYLRTIEKMPHDLLLGVTATPWRSDKRNLSEVFEDIAFEIRLIELIRRGYLADVKVQKLAVEVDITDVATRAGEYVASDVSRAIDPHLMAIAHQIARDHAHRKIITFCPSIETSMAFTAALRGFGLAAEHVDGKSEDRAAILHRFARNETRFLSNAQLLTEGYDQEDIDCVLMLSPTQSRISYSQKMGRGTRIFPGKEYVLVLDPNFRSNRQVVGPQDIVAEAEEEARLIGKYLSNGKSLLEAYDAAQEAYKAFLVKQAAKSHDRSLAFIAWALDAPELATYEPTMRWHMEPATINQRVLLQRTGIPLDEITQKGIASKVIDVVLRRRETGMATFKQVSYLRRRGIKDAPRKTFKEASEILDHLAAARS